MDLNQSDPRQKELDELRASLLAGQGEKDTPESDSLPEEQTSQVANDAGEEDKSAEDTAISEGEENSSTEDLSDEEKKILSEKAQARFRKIVQEKKQLEARLREQQEQGVIQQAPEPVEIDYSKLDVFSKSEVTPADYLKHVVEAAEQIVDRRLTTRERRDLEYQAQKVLLDDISWAKQEFPELDDTSPDYDETLAGKISSWYDTARRANPTARLKDFVGDFMGERKKGFSKGKAESLEKIRRDEATQAFTSTQTIKESSPKIEEEIRNVRTFDDLAKIRNKLTR